MEEVYDRPAWGKLAARTVKERYGDDYHTILGAKGGSAPKTKPSGWAANRKLASIAGRLGGTVSRRRKKDGSYSEPDRKVVEKRRKEFDKAYAHLLKVNRKANV